jgi:PAS domain S-box-containing protein
MPTSSLSGHLPTRTTALHRNAIPESLQQRPDHAADASERCQSPAALDEDALSVHRPSSKANTQSDDRLPTPLLQSAVEQTNDAVVITEGTPLDTPGPRITYVNPAFTDITGYEAAEAIGKTPRLLQGPATESWVLERLRRCLEEGKPFEGEAINYRKDGTPYVNQWSIAPVRDADDAITHWVSVQRDVTEQRRMGERRMEAQERERSRLAHTLHDEMGGQLASLQLLVSRIGSHVPNDQQRVASLIVELETHIDTLSSTVRHLTGAFSSRVLNDFGLSVAVDRLVEQVEFDEGLQIELHNELPQAERLSPILEHVLYRTLETTLATVARHSDAEPTTVLFRKTEHELHLRIDNSGIGFAISSEPHDQSTFSLSGMQERVDRLNGTLSINQVPNGGTRLTVTLPRPLHSLPQSPQHRP